MATAAQRIPTPTNYAILDSVSGDLDCDGIKELVVAFDTATADPNDQGIPRELFVYKKENSQWKAWKKSTQALLGSRDGGMMGDPFGEITIKNECLFISESGGSSWKWGYTDQYRYQDGEFYLIGYQSSGGKICEYWQHVDFNLSTGKMAVTKEYEKCKEDNEDDAPKVYKRENEMLYKKGLKITIQARNATDIKIVTPKYKHEIYVATKDE